MQDEALTLDRLEGMALIGSDGSKIGTVADVYYDEETDRPEWALVTTGLFGAKHSFVPITTMRFEGGELRVPFTKDKVKDAPNLDDDGELSQDEELRLAEHYGVRYSEEPSGTGMPVDRGTRPAERAVETGDRQPTPGVARGGPARDTSGPTTDSAMTRPEEELDVHEARRPSGLARLRKHGATVEGTVGGDPTTRRS